MDSGVLFHTLYVTITNSQRHEKKMVIVIHFNHSSSLFQEGIQTVAYGQIRPANTFVNNEKLIDEKLFHLVESHISRNNPIT